MGLKKWFPYLQGYIFKGFKMALSFLFARYMLVVAFGRGVR